VSLAAVPSRDPDGDAGAEWRRLLAALLREREAPRLRTLLLHDWTEHAFDPCDIAYEDGDPNPLLRRHAGRLARLERLFVGAVPFGPPPDHGVCQGVAPALAGLPALVHLHLAGERGWDLVPAAGHPGLRSLLLHVDEPDDEPIATLLAAPFPALAELDLWLCPEAREAAADGSLAAGLADEFPALQRLALRGLDDPEALAAFVATAPATSLRELAVTHAPALDDEALAPLCAAPWLARLRRLDLRGTAASPGLAATLAARGLEVVRGPVAAGPA
jgi:hypothetical protein